MLPYKDDNPTSSYPFVTVSLIALNIAIFILSVFTDPTRVVAYFGAVPRSLFTLHSASPIHPVLTVVTSMFLHGGFLHLGGNMLYLWIFGDNVEDRMGHLRFLAFYFASGFVAAYAHALSAPSSTVPMIGASGAISAVLGAYVMLYPRAQVYTVVFLLFFIQVIRLPALIVIGFWAIIQIVSGVSARGMAGGAGVAWFAHVGGFLFGLAAIRFMIPKRRRFSKWS